MLSGVPDFSGLDGTNIPDVSFRPHLLYNPFIPGSVRMDVLDKNRAANGVMCVVLVQKARRTRELSFLI